MCSKNPYSTHLSVLIQIGKLLTIRRILEFGSGQYSTLTFLDKEIFPDLEFLHSIENDKIWADKILSIINDHRFHLTAIEGSISNIIDNTFISGYDLIFVDDSQGIAERVKTIEAISNCENISGIVIIHDYEQEAYQKAAESFGHSLIFNNVIPYTGVLWNKTVMIDTKQLEALNL